MLQQTTAKIWDWMNARRSASAQRRWHKAMLTSPVVLRDGRISVPGAGTVWQRHTAHGWEYEQDDGFEEPEDNDD